MEPSERTLLLIERVYDAAAEAARWQGFVEELSRALDGARVGFGLNHPSDPLSGAAYLVGITREYRRSFGEQLIKGLPFAAHFGRDTGNRCNDLGDLFPDVELADSEFYRHWMKPQGLAPVWPIGGSVWLEPEGPVAWFYAWRPEGGRPFGPDDLALLDLVMPHLQRALRLHLRLASSAQRHRVLGEVIDRLPAGVVLLDAERKVVSANVSAERILALEDGLEVGRSGLRADDPRDQQALERLIESVLDPKPGEEGEAGGFTTVRRPSGQRSFVAMVTPLLEPLTESVAGDPVMAVFVADPEAKRSAAREVLENLYDLTPAEADLLRLLSSGHSLEQAAALREVTINTARAQLKQVFAKTDTRRQSELLRLVFSGVGRLREQ